MCERDRACVSVCVCVRALVFKYSVETTNQGLKDVQNSEEHICFFCTARRKAEKIPIAHGFAQLHNPTHHLGFIARNILELPPLRYPAIPPTHTSTKWNTIITTARMYELLLQIYKGMATIFTSRRSRIANTIPKLPPSLPPLLCPSAAAAPG